jgi:hypothetical protein
MKQAFGSRDLPPTGEAMWGHDVREKLPDVGALRTS